MPVAKSHTAVLADLKSKAFSPVYLFHGQEPYFIDLLVDAFEAKAIDEASKSFNQQVLYGRDITPGQVIDAASRYPMMSPHQLVLIKEAQDLPDIAQLEGYLTKPVPSTVLVLAYRGKKLKANTRVYKAIAKAGVVFESKPLYSNQVPNFIKGELSRRKLKADAGVTDLLAEYLGTDLVVLAGALEKLFINVPADRAITAQDVETHVGISRQFNLFELQDAIGSKEFERAVQIGYALSQNEREHPLPLTLASMYGYFAGLFAVHDVLNQSESVQMEATGINSGFRLGKIRQAAARWSKSQLMDTLELLAEYDLRSKGVEYNLSMGNGGQLTLELVERIVGIAAAQGHIQQAASR